MSHPIVTNYALRPISELASTKTRRAELFKYGGYINTAGPFVIAWEAEQFKVMDALCMKQSTESGNVVTLHYVLPDDGMNQRFVYEDQMIKWCADKAYVMDVWCGRAENCTEVRLHTIDGGNPDNQRFEFDGEGRILWKGHPNFCLDLLNGDNRNGDSRIVIHEQLPAGHPFERNQKWKLIQVKGH